MNNERTDVHDPITALRGYLVLDGLVRLTIWGGAMLMTLWILFYFNVGSGPADLRTHFHTAWVWSRTAVWMIVLFNLFYVLILVILRLLIPLPKEGRYRMVPGAPMDRQIIWSGLLSTLTKARLEAPFPAFLVYHLSNIPPLCWLVGPTLGPKNRSCNVTEPVLMDPHLIEIGRNVVIGYGAIIAGHVQDREEIVFKKTVIEDNVIIGGYTIIHCGCRIKRGAVILGGAIVNQDSIVGENEIWGGVPAKKIKDLHPYGRTSAAIE